MQSPGAGCQPSMHHRPPLYARSPSFRAWTILTNRISRPKISTVAERPVATRRQQQRDAFDASGNGTAMIAKTILTSYPMGAIIIDNLTDIVQTSDVQWHMRLFNTVCAAFYSGGHHMTDPQYKALLSNLGDFNAACPSGDFLSGDLADLNEAYPSGDFLQRCFFLCVNQFSLQSSLGLFV